jgi:hypothetical protein
MISAGMVVVVAPLDAIIRCDAISGEGPIGSIPAF